MKGIPWTVDNRYLEWELADRRRQEILIDIGEENVQAKVKYRKPNNSRVGKFVVYMRFIPK
jgi:hypothetical protein